MAFTRSEIRKILGEAHTEDIENKLVALHLGVVDSLKDERDTAKQDAEKYKAEAEKLPELQNELVDLKARKDYKPDFDRVTQEFADYKAHVVAEAEAAKVRSAFKQLLVDEKISEKRHDAIMKVTDFSGMKLGEDGKLENEAQYRKAIGEEWGEFRVSTRERGPAVETPPVNKGTARPTRKEIMEIKDDGERQKAIAENHDLFGF